MQPAMLAVRAFAQASRELPGTDVQIDVGTGLAGGAVGAAATTLVIGAVMIALFPDYTERTMDAVAAEPVESFGYGLLALVALVLVVIALVLTLVGIVVAIPLILVAILVWGVGASIAYLAIGDRLVGGESDGWLAPLLAGSLLNGALALTGIGGLVSFCLGAAGFGAILRGRREGDADRSGAEFEPAGRR